MDVKQRIRAVIDLLETVRFKTCHQRKAIYFFPVDGKSALNFVCGVRSAANALGLQENRDAWWLAIETRGWKISPLGFLPEMQERGMTDEQMAEEILAIEIDTWRILQAEILSVKEQS
ncbi:hypothetical protein PI95_017420 [Hassallia byssoidea VB512170]|uniref:Uncharacterized protein n=1 Tax=Hassallia byssoidea VB512170 TaxID=1304833 RepID=A0A846HCH0_9CYAN|nr:hypothetical protein [Hassalia byssoidea]NEU74290.1 hypothetical protein [Hassalia byssoidea VB512170]